MFWAWFKKFACVVLLLMWNWHDFDPVKTLWNNTVNPNKDSAISIPKNPYNTIPDIYLTTLMDFLFSIFGVVYPFLKMEQLALPNYQHQAMVIVDLDWTLTTAAKINNQFTIAIIQFSLLHWMTFFLARVFFYFACIDLCYLCCWL